MKKKTVYLILVLLFTVLGFVLPGFGALEAAGARCLCMFIAFLICCLTNVIPSGIASIIFTCLMGISTVGGFQGMSAAFKNVSVSLMAFCMGTLAITVALKRTTIPQRLAAFAAKVSKGNSKVIILFFMFAACLLSAIMSNVAACATIGAMAYGICKTQEESGAGVKNFGRCMMIGIPLGAGIGGCGTIAGSVNNATALEILTAYDGSTIAFGPWALVMIPATLIAMVIAWFILVTLWKPEPLSEKVIEETRNNDLGPMSALDKKVSLIIVLMVGFWISTTWIKTYNANFVSIMGLVLFVVTDCFKWSEFNSECRWDSVLLCGGVMGVVQGLINTGVGDWIGNVLFGGISSLPAVVLAMIIVLASFILHAFIPVGGPIASILTLPAITLCLNCGLNPAIAILLVLIGANTCTILPIDHLPIMTQAYGYYKGGDFTKAGIPVTIAFTILLPLIIIPLFSLVG